MKLTNELKDKINNYFDNLTPKKALGVAKKYGIMEERNLVPELKSTERVFDKYFKIDEQIFTIPKQGAEDMEISRLRLNRPDAVAVLIYNEEEGVFTFVRQYRPAIGDKNYNTPIVEIAAGLIDKGETPEEAAAREVIEETGYKLSNLDLVYTYFPGVGYCSERVHIYMATVTNKDKVEEGGGLEVEGEMMEIVDIPVAEAIEMLDNGSFCDGKTIISLQEFKNMKIELFVEGQDKYITEQREKIKNLETKLAILEKTPR